MPVVQIQKWMKIMVIFSLIAMSGCTDNAAPETLRDPHSFAHADEVVMTHLDWDAAIDFAEHRIVAKASIHVKNKTGAKRLFFDSRDLTIDKITLGEDEIETTFSIGETVEFMGQELAIDILPETKIVYVYYSSAPEAAALQWLTAEQTAGKKHPFLFSQSQAILARTWIPCQDSPGIRFTYNARVKTDPELLALMSASNPTEKSADGVYEFTMAQPIPAYLLAIAVGDVEFRSLGARSGVYAEPSVIAKAAYEFADTEKMIEAAEKLYGPYRWDRYDMIVLPPSFPFGGMENPRLTFATPTILAGDRSLVALVAHELAHSWSGNLVTSATWNDFWLNEGFTSYFENRIMEEVYGESYARMLAQLSYQDAMRDVKQLGANSPDTHLKLNLAGRDPDDTASGIVYDKGALFLVLLEKTFGREKWDPFLRGYFDKFAFQTMTSEGFVKYLRENLIKGDKELEEKLKIDQWVYGPGLPDNAPVPQSDEFAKVEAQIANWTGGTPAAKLDTNGWTTHHWLHFLRNLPKELSTAQLQDLDNAFKFTQSGNSEIACLWLEHAVNNNYTPAYDRLDDYLSQIGRRKLVLPLYTALAKTPEGLERARKIYATARAGYHPVTYATIDQILKK